jgi:hypothetical protein
VYLIHIFRYSWSEGGFIFFLLWLCLICAKVLREQSYSTADLASAIIAVTGLCLFRYIGIFAFPFLLMLSVRGMLQRNSYLSKFSLLTFFISLMLVGAYLYHNYLVSGFWFGPERGAESRGFAGNTGDLFLVLIQLSSFIWKTNTMQLIPVLLVQMVIGLACIGLCRRYLKVSFFKTEDAAGYGFSLFTAGSTYLFVLIAMRYTMHFDRFDYRLLMPGVLPMLMAGLLYLNERKAGSYPVSLLSLAAWAVLSMLLNFGPYLN